MLLLCVAAQVVRVNSRQRFDWDALARRFGGHMICRQILGRGCLLIVGILVLVPAASVLGQVATGTILGIIADPSGGAIAGATVTVTNPSTGFVRAFTTESDGSYRFPNLPVGTYNINVNVMWGSYKCSS